MRTCPYPAHSRLSALLGCIFLPFGVRDLSEGRPEPGSAANGGGGGTTTPKMLRAAPRDGVITAPGSPCGGGTDPGSGRSPGTAPAGRTGPSWVRPGRNREGRWLRTDRSLRPSGSRQRPPARSPRAPRRPHTCSGAPCPSPGPAGRCWPGSATSTPPCSSVSAETGAPSWPTERTGLGKLPRNGLGVNLKGGEQGMTSVLWQPGFLCSRLKYFPLLSLSAGSSVKARWPSSPLLKTLLTYIFTDFIMLSLILLYFFVLQTKKLFVRLSGAEDVQLPT